MFTDTINAIICAIEITRKNIDIRFGLGLER
jgi:hypothetical protein